MVGELRRVLRQGGSCGECLWVLRCDRRLRRKRSNQLKRQEQVEGNVEAERPSQSEDMNVFEKENSLRAFKETILGELWGNEEQRVLTKLTITTRSTSGRLLHLQHRYIQLIARY